MCHSVAWVCVEPAVSGISPCQLLKSTLKTENILKRIGIRNVSEDLFFLFADGDEERRRTEESLRSGAGVSAAHVFVLRLHPRFPGLDPGSIFNFVARFGAP